jgi:hypothetical protein
MNNNFDFSKTWEELDATTKERFINSLGIGFLSPENKTYVLREWEWQRKNH